jgi:hypothetical protein
MRLLTLIVSVGTLAASAALAADLELATAAAHRAPMDLSQERHLPDHLTAAEKSEVIGDFKNLLSLWQGNKRFDHWAGKAIAECSHEVNSLCTLGLGDLQASYLFSTESPGRPARMARMEITIPSTDTALCTDLRRLGTRLFGASPQIIKEGHSWHWALGSDSADLQMTASVDDSSTHFVWQETALAQSF